MDKTWLTVYLAISAYLLVWLLQRTQLNRDTGQGDLIGSLLTLRIHHLDGYILFGALWILLSFLGNVLFALTERKDFLSQPSQIAVAINYCLFVPALVAAYLYLLRSILYFPRLDSKTLMQRAHFRLITISSVSCVILYFAIESERCIPSINSPWVVGVGLLSESCRDGYKDLSWPGVFYYWIRGLNTSMALGLIVAVGYLYVHRRQRFGNRILVDNEFPGIGPTEEIRKVGLSLVLIALFGSLVTFMHGLALFIEASRIRKDPSHDGTQVVKLFMESTWLFWLVLTLLTSIACLLIVLWLREQIVSQLRIKQREYLDTSSVSLPEPLSENTWEHTKMRIDTIKAAVETKAKIGEMYSKAETWPLPPGAGAFLGVALLGQIANVAAGLYSIFKAT